MDPIGGRKVRRELDEGGLFVLEGLGGDQASLGDRSVIHADGRPLPSLHVQILQTLEAAAWQKIRLQGPETAFFPGLAVRVPLLVTPELEAVLLGKRGHLRNDDGVPARAPQPREIRVVDDADGRGISPEHQRLVEEGLHRKAVEGAVEPKVASLGVPQVQKTGDDLGEGDAAQRHRIDGGIVLHLVARLVRFASASCLPWTPEAELSHATGQGRVLDLDVLLLDQLLVDPLHAAIAFRIQPREQIRIDPDLVSPNHRRHRALPLDDGSYRLAAEVQATANLADPHPLLVEQEDGLAFVRSDHGAASSIG